MGVWMDFKLMKISNYLCSEADTTFITTELSTVMFIKLVSLLKVSWQVSHCSGASGGCGGEFWSSWVAVLMAGGREFVMPSNWGITWPRLAGELLLWLDCTMVMLLQLEVKVELAITCDLEQEFCLLVCFGEFEI